MLCRWVKQLRWSLVLFYDCEHYPVNIIHTCCSLLLTLNRFPSAPEGSTWYMQIQCNTGTYSQTFASAIQLWNTALDICQLPPDSFRTHLSSLRLLSTGIRPVFFSSALQCYYPKLLFIVCCTAFSIHVCLFTPCAIVLKIESAPLSEDDMKNPLSVW